MGLETDTRGNLYIGSDDITQFIAIISPAQPVKVKKADAGTNNSTIGLLRNYPNPFNASTIIQFNILKTSRAALKVFDVLGREVATLVEGELNPSEYSVLFYARELPSGVYCYRLQTGRVVQEKTMVLLK